MLNITIPVIYGGSNSTYRGLCCEITGLNDQYYFNKDEIYNDCCLGTNPIVLHERTTFLTWPGIFWHRFIFISMVISVVFIIETENVGIKYVYLDDGIW